jgi:Cof subfamily protein (haloacid dehalogenase superfamily)
VRPDPSWRPRLVALDVDGTLVDWVDGVETMSERVREAVRGVLEAGAHVVISTGRSVPGVMDAVDMLGFDDGIAVGSNGAVTFSYRPVEVLDVVTFDATDTVKLLLEEVPDAHVAVEEIGRGYRINKVFPEGEISGEIVVQSVEELVAEPVTRVIIRSPDQSVEDFAELAQRLGLHGINYYVGYTAWLDLAPEGVSKATGLESVASRLGVARADVLALGDGHNDIEMLAWAGRGVAMGQAPTSVQDAADDVTETVEADGVAVELARWF